MRKSNKILAVILALVMIITAVPMMTAMAADECDHEYVEQSGTVEATCTVEGKATFKCIKCDDVQVVTSDVVEHTWTGDYKTSDKEHKKICTVCEKYIVEEHDWNDGVVVKAATCKENGETKYTCKVCGYEKTDKKVEGTHTISGTPVVVNDKHVYNCSVCEKAFTESHVWDKGTVKTPKKCSADGVMTYGCTICTATKEEKIPAGHTIDKEKDTPVSVSATQHAYNCGKDCGYSEKEDHNIVVTVNYTAGTTTETTCDDKGVLKITCADCNLEAKEYTVSGSHDFKVSKYNETKHKEKCECGEEIYVNHTWDEGKETKKATCKDTGVMTYTCTACKETKTEEIPVVAEHNVPAWLTIKEATCKETGSKSGLCTICKETVTEEIPLNNEKHTWGEWVETQAPTTETEGVKTRECKDCGYKETAKIDKLEKADPILGDVNGDGSVGAADARLVLQHVANLRALTEDEMKLADMDANNEITATDARRILRVVAGLKN